MGWRQKSLMLVWWCHQLLPEFLAEGSLPQVPRQSRLSANDKGYIEMTLGAVIRYTGICLKAEEIPGKRQLGDRLMKDVRPFIASNGVSYLKMRSVGSLSRREKVGCWNCTSFTCNNYYINITNLCMNNYFNNFLFILLIGLYHEWNQGGKERTGFYHYKQQ